jgi:AraC-like DNA-binding protein
MSLNPRSHILSRYVRLESNDVSEVSEKISWARSHQIELLSPRDSHRSRLSYALLNESSLGYLVSNASFRDRIGATESAFCVVMVFEGGGEHTVARKRFPLNRTRAAVHSSGQKAEVVTNGHFGALSIGINRSSIVSEMEKCLGRTIGAPIEFAPTVNMASIGGDLLGKTANRLCQVLDQTAPIGRKLLAVRQMERWLASHLVQSHGHNYTRLLHRRPSMAGPWQVRAAEDYIRANAAMPLSVGDLASIAGVSARTLQYSFRRHRGMSPMEFLREIRLECVRSELLSAVEPATITQAAARWGFSHFGRFAAEYRRRYGEAPSATLHRRRGKGK